MKRYQFMCLALAVLVLGCGDAAWANQHHHVTPEWRIIWDQFWRIANFLVLAFLIFKVGKKPLLDFLSGQKAKVAEDITEMERQKAEAKADLEQIESKIAGIARELADYEDLVTAQAAKLRDDIMASAKFEADNIVKRTKRQMTMAIEKARLQMTSELVELAGVDAYEIISKAITAQDHSRMVTKFVTEVGERSAA